MTETFICNHDRVSLMTRTSLILKVIAALMLVGTASAAIYAGIYSEAVVSFNAGSAPPNGTQISNFVEYGEESQQSIDIGALNTSEMHMITIRQRNAGEDNYTSTVYFEISCDEGLVRRGYADWTPTFAPTIDFVTLNYTDHHGVTHDCNQNLQWISDTTVRAYPPMDAFTFEPGYLHYTQMDVQLHPMAYGNYTIEVHVV